MCQVLIYLVPKNAFFVPDKDLDFSAISTDSLEISYRLPDSHHHLDVLYTRLRLQFQIGCILEIKSHRIYFVSDTHFRGNRLPEEKAKQKRFFAFLESIPEEASLFLLGDIFDFYFEYSSVIHSLYLDIFCSLRRLRDHGIRMHFLGGNHDAWPGRFLRDEIGITIHKDKITFKAQDRKISCAHGDLVIPGDVGYKILKSIIRNRLVVSCARLLHPDFLSAIAGLAAKGSRMITKRSQESMAKKIADAAFDNYFSEGNDIFVMGHVHHPTHRSRGGNDFIILGDWIEHFTYAVLQNGVIKLERFTGPTQD